MSLSVQFLDELRARTTLSTLIGKTTKVQKAGREYKACCPFHNEKTPSFTINDEKGFYHCFGCGAHGDAIRWMTDQRGLPFLDAIKELAAAAGMEVPAPDPLAAKRAEKAQSLHDVTSAAQDWFLEQLESIEGAEARAYIQKRGISAATRTAFGIGFSPDSRGRLKAALSTFPEAMVVESGMLIQPEEGTDGKARESYDRFRGRLMIPIRDQRGRVIAFGGRILGKGEPKYLNSPETPIFDKGRTLYNLDKAAPAARKTGRVLVVEGYMDAIMVAQSGIPEVVAPLGTALTETQIEKLWSMVPTPTLCFDGDSAGQRAAIRAAHRALPLLKPGHSLSFATLPMGQDPDDVIQELGVEEFEKILGRALPLDEFLWRSEEAALPLDTPEQRADLKQRLENLAAAITDSVIRSEYRRILIDKFYDKYGWKKNQRDKILGFAKEVRTEIEKNLPQKVFSAVNRAILFGLMKWPAVIYDKREQIVEIRMPTKYLSRWRDIIIDASYENLNLKEDFIQQILDDSDLDPKVKFDFLTDLNFSFLAPNAEMNSSIEMLTTCIDAIFEEQRADEELERLGFSKTFPFDIKKEHAEAMSEFRESEWASLRLLYSIKEQAHLRLQRYAETVEALLRAA